MRVQLLGPGTYQGGVISAMVQVPANVSTINLNAYVAEGDRLTEKRISIYGEKSTDAGANWLASVADPNIYGPWVDEPYVAGIGMGVSGLVGKHIRVRLDLPESIELLEVVAETE